MERTCDYLLPVESHRYIVCVDYGGGIEDAQCALYGKSFKMPPFYTERTALPYDTEVKGTGLHILHCCQEHHAAVRRMSKAKMCAIVLYQLQQGVDFDFEKRQAAGRCFTLV